MYLFFEKIENEKKNREYLTNFKTSQTFDFCFFMKNTNY